MTKLLNRMTRYREGIPILSQAPEKAHSPRTVVVLVMTRETPSDNHVE